MEIKGIINRYLEPNTDTDIIIPARFLKRTALTNFEQFAFFERRYLPSTICQPSLEKKDFVFQRKDFNNHCSLNHPNSKNASFLLTWFNFGCGSSREHAVYALSNYKVIIGSAPKNKSAFADIFRDNCRQNLIWTPVISETNHQRLNKFIDSNISKSSISLTLNIMDQILLTSDDNLSIPFEIPQLHKEYLIGKTDPFKVAKEEIITTIKEIDTWYEETKSNRKFYPIISKSS